MRVVVNAVAIAAAAWLLAGIRLTDAGRGDQLLTLLVVGVLFGVVNAVVRPVVKFFSFPFILLTLGLLIFVINALMLMLTGWLSEQLGLGFSVDGFWTAIVGALIISVVSWCLELVLPGDR
ncbi:phage holin family protein [Nocardioides panacis]|uniref:Phage holin family protein n=2 Tax=Nocardioides panacis TaxID=2849501 RepID=A0A975T334_9ACTN|nr:phage holin family protein [Nocardioides panacis]